MLLTLGFAAVPILLHIFRKKTARRVLWGAWMFLAESLRERKRRIFLEELILLVTRTLILAFAAFAFARPFLPEMHLFGARGMSRDVVLVMDTSASMSLCRPDGKNAFSESVEEARELVRLAPKDTAFAVVDAGSEPSGGHPRILTASLFTDKKEVYAALDALKPGAGTMDVPETLAAAAEILAGGNNPAKEVVVFGDGQAYGWKTSDGPAWLAVEQLMARFKIRPSVVWRTPERPEHVTNAAIESLTPSRRIISTDRPVRFEVSVLNAGSEAVNPGDLTFKVDGALVARRSVGQILPGLAKTLDFSHLFLTNGHHEVVTELAMADDILADNCVTNPVEVLPELNVLLVNGHPDAEGFERPIAFLEAALMGGVTSRTVRASQLEKAEVFRDAAVVALCDVPMLSPRAATNLAEYVRDGGGLLVVPADRARIPFYADWKLKGENVLAAVWTNFSGRAHFVEESLTNRIDVTRRFSNADAAFVVSTFGRGRTGVYAEPFDTTWSALPSRPEFVPLAHELVYDLVSTNSVTALVDTRRRAMEGDMTPLKPDEMDAVRVHVDLSLARLKDDVLSAVLGKSFGVEIWRPFAVCVLLLMIFELLFARYVDASRRGEKPNWRLTRPDAKSVRTYLRVLALLAIAWMLLHISWVHDVTRTVHRRVAVLTDTSLSMRRYDLDEFGETNAVSRLDVATNVADRLVAGLGGRYDVESMAFGGETTDFAEALEKVLERIREEELAGCVFVTDGRLTGGAPVEAAARRFARAGAHVSTVLVGAVTNRCDAAIEAVRAPETIFLGDKARVAVTLRADALEKKKVTCRFFDGDKELDKREFDVDAESWTKEVRFQHEPDVKGVRHYRVTLETDGEDVERANNEWPVDVVVSDDRTNVLVIDRRPRWEFRYLRNLFYARDKSVNLQYVLTEPDMLSGASSTLPSASATREFGDAEAGSLPANRDEWRRFDVIILGDLPPETLTDDVAADLKFCIEERGAAVVFIAGERYLPPKFAGLALAELFPAAVTNAVGEMTAKWAVEKYPFALSPSGASHDLMRLSDSESENRTIWDSLPDWSAHLKGLTVRPGAEILAYAGDSTALADPLVVVQHRGRGKVVLLTTDETWRLRYRKGDTYHHRFWGNLLRWGAGLKLSSGNAFARIGTDRLHYTPGSDVHLAVRFTDKESMPVLDADPVAKIKLPDGREREVPLRPREDSNGIYETKLERLEAQGAYVVTVTSAQARKVLGEDFPEKLETAFSLETGFLPVEYTHLSSDDVVPKEMARLTGGQVVAVDDAASLEEAFGEGRGEVTEHVEKPLWSHPLVFFLLALPLIAVWYLRKRRGLA